MKEEKEERFLLGEFTVRITLPTRVSDVEAERISKEIEKLNLHIKVSEFLHNYIKVISDDLEII